MATFISQSGVSSPRGGNKEKKLLLCLLRALASKQIIIVQRSSLSIPVLKGSSGNKEKPAPDLATVRSKLTEGAAMCPTLPPDRTDHLLPRPERMERPKATDISVCL